jgi:eukaryotic-like serine/threonine-protein kinase
MTTPSIDEKARRRFESAWTARRPIAIENCLPPASDPAWLPTLEELVLIELEFGWKTNHKAGPLVEDYLDRFPQLLRADILLRLIQQEYEVRQSYGDRPTREQYRKRFPDVILTGDELHPAKTPPLASQPITSAKMTQVESAKENVTAAPTGPPHDPAAEPRPADSHARQREGRSRYTLTRLHAEGGLGRVWIARDADLNRDVALKELKPSSASHPEAWQRFVKEAQVTGQLEHPNIVPVYELDRRPGDEQPFYTMRFVHGQTLRDAAADYHRRRRGGSDDPVEWLRLLQAFVSVCNAVSYAHSRGVIHRDLKPENVLLGGFGEVLVLDWGLAKTSESKDERLTPIDVSKTAADVLTTVSGRILGTPAYMAPEQAEGRIDLIDERTDVYGLGAILFEILTGRPPHLHGDTADIVGQIIRDPTPLPRSVNSATPRALEAICLAAMAKQRSQRYPAAEELDRDIQRYLADEPVSVYREPRSARVGRFVRHHRTKVAFAAAAALVALVSGAIGLYFFMQSKDRALQETEARMGRLMISVQADRDFALKELKRDNFVAADDLLQRTAGKLSNDRNKPDVDARPKMVELRTELNTQYERLHRIAEFYKLVDAAQRLAFFQYDDLAEDACQAAVDLFGALRDPKWFDDLPASELTPDQHERLQEEVLRQLLFLAAMRAKHGFMNLTDPQNAAAYRSALEALTAANRWKPSESARLIAVFCRIGLGSRDIAKAGFSKPIEPTCAADYYFLGILHLWVSQTQDEAVREFLKASQPLTGVDFSDSLDRSERLLRRAASMQPRHYWTYFWLGWNRLVGKRYSAAELAFDSCIALRPDYALGYAYRGWSLFQESQAGQDAKMQAELRTRGLADLTHARSIEPVNPEFAWLTGLTLADTDQPREALQAFQRATELEPPLKAWLGRPIYGEKQKHFQRMREVAKTMTDKDPRNPDNWAALAAADWALGAANDADQAAGHTLKLKPNQPVALAVRGSVSLERKKFAAALADFRAARAKQPKLWLAAHGEAQAIESQGTPDQALDAFDALTEIAETDWQKVEAELGRARVLARLNRSDEAAEALKAAQAIDPRAGKS